MPVHVNRLQVPNIQTAALRLEREHVLLNITKQ